MEENTLKNTILGIRCFIWKSFSPGFIIDSEKRNLLLTLKISKMVYKILDTGYGYTYTYVFLNNFRINVFLRSHLKVQYF